MRSRLSSKEKDFRDLKSVSRELKMENDQLVNKLVCTVPGCLTKETN